MTDGWALRRITAPRDEPLALAEAKDHLRVDGKDSDARIRGLITAAREHVEGIIGRSLLTQSWRLSLDRWPYDGVIRLPKPPLLQVDQVTYVDPDGVTKTWSSDEYRVDTQDEPGRLTLAWDASWPSLRHVIGAVQVDYTAGHAVAFTADNTNDTLTAAGHTYAADDVVRLTNSGGALPAGLAAETDYYVINVSGNTLQLATSQGGSAVSFTDDGTGTHYLGIVPEPIRQAMLLLVGHWYEHREQASPASIEQIPVAAQSLLAPYRVFPME
jgi:uncharacterized phiE125 gp8 family phage protein